MTRKASDLVTARDAGNPIHYCLPSPSVFRKFYNQEQLFDAVNWSDWPAVVDGFETRIEKWYFGQMRGGHASYLDLCALCALIDFFSLHWAQLFWHTPRAYKDFLRNLDPVFQRHLPQRVRVTRHQGSSWRYGWLNEIADVFYAGVRCSLHHHGDLASYAAMTGSGELAKIIPNAGSSLCGKYTYSLVIFDPGVLQARLHSWFANYCATLRRDSTSQIAQHFKARLHASYGIVVP